MRCEGDEAVNRKTKKKKEAMWVYPKVSGFNPSERWGHSACFSHGCLFVFGGCRGGLHFSDVLILSLDTMTWRTLLTTGSGPGPRDSHSSVLVGHRMIVFGGTNGSKKLNDLHVLDLRTREWTQPETRGEPPAPRESHTTTLVGLDRIVIFGGSGEGEGNYLNDLHVLDLNTMTWTCPEVTGRVPVRRDSHSSVSVGSKVLVFGGDCGDRYLGDVDVLDTDTMTWSKLGVKGFSPGVRAGHGAVSIGAKVYVIGGVGDRHYYNDVWVLDVITCSWNRLDVQGQQPEGRFSHTAVAMGTDIAIYGGCGEDERTLNELLILQLDADENPNGHNYVSSMRDVFYEKKEIMPRKGADGHYLPSASGGFLIHEINISSSGFETRRTIGNSCPWEVAESEQEEHSLSLSQNSSPSQSDHEQNPAIKSTANLTEGSEKFHLFKKWNQIHGDELCSPNASISEKEIMECAGKSQFEPKQMPPPEIWPLQNLIGADVCGKVDGAFDSGYLVTATVNGRIFRGVLFAPGPVSMWAAQHPSNHMTRRQIPTLCPVRNSSRASSLARHSKPEAVAYDERARGRRNSSRAVLESKHRTDLQGVDLTLGGPGWGV